MQNDDLQPLVDELAERLQRSVAIDDPSIRLLAASRHFGDEDPLRVTSVLNRAVPTDITEPIFALGIATWTKPGRVEVTGANGIDLTARLCAPVRCNGLLLGYLWLIDRDDAPLAQDEIDLAAETAARAGVVLYGRLLLHERSRTRHGSILRELVSSDPAARAHAEEDLRAEQLFPEQAMRYQVVAVQRGPTSLTTDPQDVALEAAVEDGLRAVPDGTALIAANRSRAWILLAQPERPSAVRLDALSTRITARFRSLAAPGARLVIGIGDAVSGLDAVVDSYRQAFLAARASLLVGSIGDVARWGELGPYEILLRMPSEDVLRGAHVPALATLDAGDSHGVLVETLEAFFDNAGDVRRTAELLCVHRATLYHRLRRIEQLTGCSLDSGDDRLTLHLGLKLRGLAAAYRSQTGPAG